MNVDYIIVGQGICGTLLSHFFEVKNISYVIIDKPQSNSSSKVASGVINPITGRRFVRTWMIDEVLPFSIQTYRAIETILETEIIEEKPILDFFLTMQMKNAFEQKLLTEEKYLSLEVEKNKYENYFNSSFGVGEINSSRLVNLQNLLPKWREKLLSKNKLLEIEFEIKQLHLKNNSIQYQNIFASKIIFCDGVSSAQNKYFKHLPFALNKGEALIVEIPGLPQTQIYKNGITIVPWIDNQFWVGSSYEWNYNNNLPSLEFKTKVELQLKNWLKISFKINDHIASIRPTNIERRPFVGFLQNHPQIGILNGMGTKGCSLAPFFAYELVENIINKKQIHIEADVNRFLQ